jgi:hypothetical protein
VTRTTDGVSPLVVAVVDDSAMTMGFQKIQIVIYRMRKKGRLGSYCNNVSIVISLYLSFLFVASIKTTIAVCSLDQVILTLFLKIRQVFLLACRVVVHLKKIHKRSSKL